MRQALTCICIKDSKMDPSQRRRLVLLFKNIPLFAHSPDGFPAKIANRFQTDETIHRLFKTHYYLTVQSPHFTPLAHRTLGRKSRNEWWTQMCDDSNKKDHGVQNTKWEDELKRWFVKLLVRSFGGTVELNLAGKDSDHNNNGPRVLFWPTGRSNKTNNEWTDFRSPTRSEVLQFPRRLHLCARILTFWSYSSAPGWPFSRSSVGLSTVYRKQRQQARKK